MQTVSWYPDESGWIGISKADEAIEWFFDEVEMTPGIKTLSHSHEGVAGRQLPHAYAGVRIVPERAAMGIASGAARTVWSGSAHLSVLLRTAERRSGWGRLALD